MKRKEFLINGGLATLGLLAGLAQSRCKSSTTPSDPTLEHTFTSNTVNGHNHNITISKTEVQSPPTAGISRSTSSGPGHSHTFAMTQSQLQDVMNGTAEGISTGTTDSHSHEFTISKWF